MLEVETIFNSGTLNGGRSVRVLGFGDSAINLRAYIWSEDSASGFFMKCDLYKLIKEEFDKNNIEIPYPHRTIVNKIECKNEIS